MNNAANEIEISKLIIAPEKNGYNGDIYTIAKSMLIYRYLIYSNNLMHYNEKNRLDDKILETLDSNSKKRAQDYINRLLSLTIRQLYDILPYVPNQDIIKNLSMCYYERKEVHSKNLAFIPYKMQDQMKNKVLDFRYSNPLCTEFDYDEISKIRKQIQPITPDSCLVFELDESNETYKTIGITRNEKLESIALYYVTITQYMEFIVHSIFIKEEDNKKGVRIPILGFSKGEYKEVEKIMGEIEEERVTSFKNQIDKYKISSALKELITTIIEEKHGTSLVIFRNKDDAVNESERLASFRPGRGTLLDHPVKLDRNILKNIVDIDGGIIIDLDCNCYAFGCIFDGVVTQDFKGDMGRGARYNSIKMYTERWNGFSILGKKNASRIKCIGIVFSDDGKIDLFPVEKGK